jgi:hypothetical protein
MISRGEVSVLPNKYYFIDVNTETLEVVGIGVTETANPSGDNVNDGIHRVSLPSQGQYNKLISKISKSRLARLFTQDD